MAAAGSPPFRGSPLASPSSPDYIRMGMPRSNSTSSASAMEDPEPFRFIRSYARSFVNKLVQALVQARQNEKYDLKCTVAGDGPVSWFSVNLDEIGEVSVLTKKSLREYPPVVPCISIDFILYTSDGEILPLETWCFSWIPSNNPFAAVAAAAHVSDTRSKLYNDLATLLKSSMCAARMTPMHRYYVRKQSAETFVITYRVLEGASKIELGAECKKRTMAVIETPLGNFHLDLAYRTRMEIERAPTPASTGSFQQVEALAATITTVQITPGTSPDSHHPVGTPSSFCEVLSQFSTSPASQLATSPPEGFRPSRSRAASEATSEGSCVPLSGRSPPDVIHERDEKEELTPRRDDEEDDDDLMATSTVAANRAKDMPFGNLFLSSYTGILMANNVDEEQKERMEKGVERDASSSHTLNTEMNMSTRTVTAVPEEGEEGGEMTETIKAGKLGGESSSAPALPTFSPLGGSSSDRKKDSDDEEEEEEQDSFVRVLPFFEGRSATTESQAQKDAIGELINQLKTTPTIEGNVGYDLANLADVTKKELAEFARFQGDFDRLVSIVREAVEEEDRKERQLNQTKMSPP